MNKSLTGDPCVYCGRLLTLDDARSTYPHHCSECRIEIDKHCIQCGMLLNRGVYSMCPACADDASAEIAAAAAAVRRDAESIRDFNPGEPVAPGAAKNRRTRAGTPSGVEFGSGGMESRHADQESTMTTEESGLRLAISDRGHTEDKGARPFDRHSQCMDSRSSDRPAFNHFTPAVHQECGAKRGVELDAGASLFLFNPDIGEILNSEQETPLPAAASLAGAFGLIAGFALLLAFI